MSESAPSRQFEAMQHFGSIGYEADIRTVDLGNHIDADAHFRHSTINFAVVHNTVSRHGLV
jgi:hypothetical protein